MHRDISRRVSLAARLLEQQVSRTVPAWQKTFALLCATLFSPETTATTHQKPAIVPFLPVDFERFHRSIPFSHNIQAVVDFVAIVRRCALWASTLWLQAVLNRCVFGVSETAHLRCSAAPNTIDTALIHQPLEGSSGM